MNPFERLRKAIDNVNINYQFPEDESPENSIPPHPHLTPSHHVVSSNPNNEEIQKVKEVWQNQHLNSVRQITDLAAKVEQLEKNLKRSEAVIQNQVNEIVELEQ